MQNYTALKLTNIPELHTLSRKKSNPTCLICYFNHAEAICINPVQFKGGRLKTRGVGSFLASEKMNNSKYSLDLLLKVITVSVESIVLSVNYQNWNFKMKIMFDTNVWQKVVFPEDYENKEETKCFEIINEAIRDGRITPYLSETIFTLELIRREERHQFFGDVVSKITVEDKSTSEIVGGIITTGPDPKDFVSFDKDPILKKYFSKAIRLDFKIVKFPRCGGIRNTGLEGNLMTIDDATRARMCEVEEQIFKKGGGFFWIEDLIKNCDSSNIANKIKQLPASERTKAEKVVAEWSDGDSVACCIALGCDYFCTRDTANSAGGNSILSQENLIRFDKEYGFKTIKPEKLMDCILKQKTL